MEMGPFRKPTRPLNQGYSLKDQTHMATLHHGSHLECELSSVGLAFATSNVIIGIMNDHSYWMYFSVIYVQEQQLSFNIILTPLTTSHSCFLWKYSEGARELVVLNLKLLQIIGLVHFNENAMWGDFIKSGEFRPGLEPKVRMF